MTLRFPINLKHLLSAAHLALGAIFLTKRGTCGAGPVRLSDQPIRVIVPFAAGGVADITIRIVAEKLGDNLGQRLVIREHAGRGRRRCGARSAVVAAGWLYAGAAQQRHRRQRAAVQEPAIRSREELCADLQHRLLRFHRRHQYEFATQDAGRRHQVRARQSAAN